MNSLQKKKVIKPLYSHWKQMSNKELRDTLLDFKEWCSKGSLIINKQGHAVPFELNEAQKKVAELILSKAFAPIPEPVTLVIHKSRQMGISVLLAALEQYLVDRKQNLNITHLFPDEQLASQFFNEKWQPLAEGCLLPDAEIMTEKGWMKISEYSGQKILIGDGERAWFENVVPVQYDYDDYLIKYTTRRYEHISTKQHRIIFKRNGKITERRAYEGLPVDGNHNKFITTLELDGEGVSLTPDELRLAVAFSADGHLPQDRTTVTFQFAKERKIERLKGILAKLGVPYSCKLCHGQNEGQFKIRFNISSLRFPLSKVFPNEWLSSLSLLQRKVILDELSFWDGHDKRLDKNNPRNSVEYYTTIRENALWVVTLANTMGINANYYCRRRAREKWSDMYQVQVLFDKTDPDTQNLSMEKIRYRGKVYCFETSTGMFWTRINGFMSLTGNSHPQLLPDMYPTITPVPYVKVGDFHGINMNCNIKIGGAGSPAAGRSGALAHDTPVPTPYGWTTHGELKVGDLIFGGGGKITKVIYAKPERYTQLYKVTLSDGSSLEADDEHLWECIIRRGPSEGKPPKHHILTTLQIKERLSLGRETLIPVHKSVSYTYKELPIDPYKLGLLLGDGYIDKKGRPAFCSMDEGLLLNFEGHRWIDKGLLNIHPKGCAAVLRRLGLAGHRSYEKFIPQEYLQSSEEQRIALLQGIMDTDGYWSQTDNRGGFTTTSKELAYGVKELVMSLGGHCSVHYYDTVGRVSSSGVISRHGEYKVNIRVWFNPFRLERKKNIWEKPQDKKYLTVKSVEPTRVDWCKCIEVDDPTHTYLAGEDFMVTHNTNHVVILDEYAFYPNVKALERGILATQPKTGMVLTIYVSTANGANWFYDACKQAEKSSRMEHLFLPWHMLKEYEMDVTPDSRFYNLDLYKPTEYDLKLMDIFEKTGYPPETWLRKMEWYDHTLEKEAKGDRDFMASEYPSTSEESFESTGRPCLPAKIIRYWIDKNQNDKLTFVDQFSQTDKRTRRPKVVIAPTDKSAVRMFRPPIPGHRYMLACDPSEGDYAGDRSAFVVVDIKTMEEVCFSADYLEAEELADALLAYAKYYNNAMIVVERNMGQAVIEFLKMSGYYRLYVDPTSSSLKYGVRTTQATKNEAIRRLRFLLNNGFYKPHDPLFLEEAQHFSWKQLPGGSWRVEATGTDENGQPYHDDCHAKGTLILTDKGEIPIEKIKCGDRVLTRNGYRKVICTSKRVKKCVSKYGRSWSPDHPVITPTGKTAFGNLDIHDRIYTWEQRLSTTGKNTTDTQIQKEDICESTIGIMGHGNNRPSHSTHRFGKTIMGRFLKATSSIIKTGTHRIMTSLILSALRRKNIWPVITKMKSGLGEQELEYLKDNGIDENMFISVKNVAKNLSLINRMGLYIVQICVERGIVPRWARIYTTESVDVVIDLSKLLQGTRDVATSASEKVLYAISVEDDHEYFADGVLVSNTIAARWTLALALDMKKFNGYYTDSKTKKLL